MLTSSNEGVYFTAYVLFLRKTKLKHMYSLFSLLKYVHFFSDLHRLFSKKTQYS